MSAPAVRFPAIAARFPHFGDALSRLIGYKPVRMGDDFVIMENDRRLSSSPEAVRLMPKIDLRKGSRHKISQRLISALPRTMDEFFEAHRFDIQMNFYEDTEMLRFYKMHVKLSSAQLSEVRTVLRDDVLPLMVDEAGAEWACPLVVESHVQQAHVTCAKISILLKDHNLEEAHRLATESYAFRGILPSSFDLLAYSSVLTRLLPFAFTLPVQRADCSWHFVGPKVWFFEYERCISFFEVVSDKIIPLTGEHSLAGIRKLASLTGQDIVGYLTFAPKQFPI